MSILYIQALTTRGTMARIGKVGTDSGADYRVRPGTNVVKYAKRLARFFAHVDGYGYAEVWQFKPRKMIYAVAHH